MLGLAVRGLGKQRTGQGEFVREFGRVHGSEECVHSLRVALSLNIRGADTIARSP